MHRNQGMAGGLKPCHLSKALSSDPGETQQPISCMHNCLYPSLGGEDQSHCYVNQSPKMEHHLRTDEGQLLAGYDKQKPEVTIKTD